MFEAMSSAKLARLVRYAGKEAVVAGPGVHPAVAEALVLAARRLPVAALTVVVDCSESVFRLGLGDLAAVEMLRAAGITVRHSPGLRLGAAIVDGVGWTYAPAPLCVSAEPQSYETPNAVRLTGTAVAELRRAIVPEPQLPLFSFPPAAAGAVAGQASRDLADPPKAPLDANVVEVGVAEVSPRQVAEIRRRLEVAPPVPFDIARQVRVFTPYIQYIDVHLRGCAITRRRVQIPKSIVNLGGRVDVAERLRTTFDLIEKDSAVSSAGIEQDVRDLLKTFTKSLGESWGRVLLRAKLPEVEKRIAAIREHITSHQERVRQRLAGELAKSQKAVVRYYRPFVKRRPPEELKAQVSEVTTEVAGKWLAAELAKAFPPAEELIADMRFDVQFHDFTYKTLTDREFGTKLREAFPFVDWDKPFSEFTAAGEATQPNGLRPKDERR